MKWYLWGFIAVVCAVAVLAGISTFSKQAGNTGAVVSTPGSPPDIRAPSVTILSPSEGQQFTEQVITVSGTASDETALAEVKVKVNDGQWIAAGKESWSATVTFSPGQNTIHAQAFDEAGNPSPVSAVTVSYNP